MILFALRFVRKGFDRILGGDLLDWLQGFTRNRLRAFTGGVASGLVMPSSTAMAFLSVQMSREGKIPWTHVMAVLFGAQVGFTAMIQILSLNLNQYAGVFLSIGGFLFLFTKSRQSRGIGQSILAFGFLFVGMGFISSSARALGTDDNVIELFAALASFPLLLFIGAMLITVMMQSSTASIAVALALSQGGELEPILVFAWVLGANAGLTLTVLIAGWSRLEGRRLGLANALVKVPLALIFLSVFMILGSKFFDQLPGAIVQQAAWLHTFFNLSACLSLFFAASFEKFLKAIIPEPPAAGKKEFPHLDSMLLQNPSIAMGAALRESLRLFDTFHLISQKALSPVFYEVARNGVVQDTSASISIYLRDVSTLRKSIGDFLDEIPDDALDEEDRRMKDTLDDLLREMPLMIRTVQDVVAPSVMKLLAKQPEDKDQVKKVILEISKKFEKQVETLARMLMSGNESIGKEIIDTKQALSSQLIQLKRQTPGLPEPAWNILDAFQQLNRRLASIAYIYARDLQKDSEPPDLPEPPH